MQQYFFIRLKTKKKEMPGNQKKKRIFIPTWTKMAVSQEHTERE